MMKKLMTLLVLLAMFTTGTLDGYAEVHTHITATGTNTLNAEAIKSKADTGTLLVAIQNHTTTANYYINKEGKASNSFDAGDFTTTWKVEPYNSAYALKNCEGKYIKEAVRPVTLTETLSEALLFMPTDCEAGVENIGSGFNSSQAVRWKLASDNTTQMNTNGMNTSTTVQFNGGTGNWTCLFTYEVTLNDNIIKKTDAAELEDGYYIIQGTASNNKGFWYHDTSLGDNRLYRMSTTSSPDLLGYNQNFKDNLKYVWKLKKSESSFTLQNVATDAYVPADDDRNKNFTGSATANLVWDSTNGAISQTNYAHTDGTLYVHCNAPKGDMNLSYWTTGPSGVNTGSGSLVAPRIFKVDDDIIDYYYSILPQINALDWGTGLNQYCPTGTFAGYTASISSIISGLNSQGYSAANFSMAQGLLENKALNMPTTNKFYRFHVGDKYACNVIKSKEDNSRTVTTTNDDASTIFYLDGSNYLIAYADGYGFNYGHCKALEPGIFNTFSFSESATAGKYLIHSNAGTGDKTWSDRDLSQDGEKLIEGAGAWSIEEVETLPVTITSTQWASLYAPVALTVPEGVTAYWGEDNGERVTLHAIEAGEIIPDSTGVVLYAETADTYSFAITTGGSIDGENALAGTVATITRTQTESKYDSYILSGGSNGVGFYRDGASTLQGFKSYLPAGESDGLVKTFSFDTETAIAAIEDMQNQRRAYYDLSGRRVEKPVRGLYIVDGRKVVIK